LKPAPTRRLLAAYAALALPLAMVSLPVYLHLPKFYQSSFGLDLGVLGGLLLLTRACDAALDPLLGQWGDRAHARGVPRLHWIPRGLPVLILGLMALFNPPSEMSPGLAAAWLACSSVLVYVGLSAVQINYQTFGAELGHTPTERTQITAWREAFTLGGVLIGASLPAWLTTSLPEGRAFSALGVGLALLLVLAGVVTLRGTRNMETARSVAQEDTASAKSPLQDPAFRRLALIYLCNGTAASIPSTLVLFYIEDVIGQPTMTAQFLLIYFLAGALGMPLWPWLAQRLGTARAWQVSMGLTLVVFLWAGTLGQGDVLGFGLICALSGLALGGDLALPPALLAGLLQGRGAEIGAPAGASYFGWWNLLSKLSLGLAAGLALPLASALGYTPGTSTELGGLRFCYAFLPCVVKLLAMILLQILWISPRENS
jgi:GPH family glycoside/pentoside/hexuronide:cation symporter